MAPRLPRASDASGRLAETVSRNVSPTPPNWIELDSTIWKRPLWISRKWLRRGNSQSGNRGSNPRSGMAHRSASLLTKTGCWVLREGVGLEELSGQKRSRAAKVPTVARRTKRTMAFP
jgi:hypothetical protein